MRNWHSLFLAAFLGITLAACSSEDNSSTENSVVGFDFANWKSTNFTCESHSLSWNDVNDWYYQLQFMDYYALSRTQYDLIVIDGEPRNPINRNILDRIRCDGAGEKLVLAYLAVGKAEEFRDYWQQGWTIGNPQWIARPNVGWPGEYIVRYWDPAWKKLVIDRLDALVAAGFDGVVLDGVDVYRSFIDENPDAVLDLQEFVKEIKDYAIEKSGNPDFGIFVQNTEELISNTAIDWAGNLTGLIKVSHFFAAVDQPVAQSLSDIYAQHLQNWVAANKLVLSLDYSRTPENIATAHTRALELGYVPLTVNSQGLDNLTIPDGYEPD